MKPVDTFAERLVFDARTRDEAVARLRLALAGTPAPQDAQRAAEAVRAAAERAEQRGAA